MPKFRKKPITIIAVQWFPPDDERHNPAHKVGCEVGMADIGTITVIQPDANNKFYSIKTVSGWAKLESGDWIITGPVTPERQRDIYPCKRDVFEATYEPASTIDARHCSRCGLGPMEHLLESGQDFCRACDNATRAIDSERIEKELRTALEETRADVSQANHVFDIMNIPRDADDGSKLTLLGRARIAQDRVANARIVAERSVQPDGAIG